MLYLFQVTFTLICMKNSASQSKGLRIKRIVIRSYAMELYALMNSIRFGPDNPNLYDEQLKWIRNIMSGVFFLYERDFFAVKIISLIRCASLSDKMGLFAKMIKVYKYWSFWITSIYYGKRVMILIQSAFKIHVWRSWSFWFQWSSINLWAVIFFQNSNLLLSNLFGWMEQKKNNIKIEFSTRHKAYSFQNVYLLIATF